MYTSGNEKYDRQDILWNRVDEYGVTLYTITNGVLDLIDIPWKMWDDIRAHVRIRRELLEAELAASTEAAKIPPLTMPNFNEIDFKNFPK